MRSPKLFSETGNRIKETGNGIIFSYLQTSDQKTSFYYLKTYKQKTYFTKYFLFNTKSPKPVLETENRIIEIGTGIIFTYLQTSDQKTSFAKVFLFNLMSPNQWKQEI